MIQGSLSLGVYQSPALVTFCRPYLMSAAAAAAPAAAAAAKSLQSCLTLCAKLPQPWESPGKNTGVGCHFFVQCMKVKSEREATQSCLTLSDRMDGSLAGRLLRP